MSTEVLVDIHCHQYRPVGYIQILSRDILECLKNANNILLKSQTINAQNQTDLLPAACYFSLGIHPWFIEQQNIDTAFQVLESFQYHPQLLAIGECGLDRCIDTALDRQIDIFSRQIAWAERINKPLIVHCVRAFAELLQLKKKFAPNQAWIIHGFGGKPALANQLVKHGCYLSFGKAILKANHPANLALQATPIGRLFLETDAADISIDTIYVAAAKMRGIDIASLRQQILDNFNRVFLHD